MKTRLAILGLALAAPAHAASIACDPKADSQPALQAALDAGGTIDITTNGKCLLGKGLVITQPGTTLNGAGQGVTMLKAMTADKYDVLTIGVAAVQFHASGITVSNLTLNGAMLEPAPVVKISTGRCLVVEGGIFADDAHPFGLKVTNVTTRNCTDGVTMHGGDAVFAHLRSFNNRHAGFFVQGNNRFPPPHDYAQHIKLTGSELYANTLDSRSGMTWDEVFIGSYTRDVTIGGPNAGDGNRLTNGDIVLSCPPTDDKCQGDPIGPFLVQRNTVNNLDSTVQGIGIRTYGNVRDATIDGNTVQTPTNGIGVFGNSTHILVTRNSVSRSIASGIALHALLTDSNGNPAIGDDITVDRNTVSMDNPHKPGVSVIAHTHVTLTDNNTNGAPYDVDQAGDGFSAAGNK